MTDPDPTQCNRPDPDLCGTPSCANYVPPTDGEGD